MLTFLTHTVFRTSFLTDFLITKKSPLPPSLFSLICEWMLLCIFYIVVCDIQSSWVAAIIDFHGLQTKLCLTHSTIFSRSCGQPLLLFLHKEPVSLNFWYHHRMLLWFGASCPQWFYMPVATKITGREKKKNTFHILIHKIFPLSLLPFLDFNHSILWMCCFLLIDEGKTKTKTT